MTRKLELAKDEVGLEIASAMARSGANGDRELKQVVFTPALRAWYVFHTLAIAYREAYHSQLNERFKGKWQEYRDLAKWASQLLFEIGVGMVSDPVPEASKPSVQAVAGSMDAGSYFVRVAWVNAAGEEGLPSAPVAVDVAEDETMSVQVSGLPPNVTGWHLYLGEGPEDVARQTTAPLDRTAGWVCGGVIATEGASTGNGQEAAYYRQMPRVFLRG